MAEVDDSFILNDEALDDLYAWIDAIPLSRPKKNIARDFSDGVLVAEIVAHFLPKMVDIHNYFSANSAGQKKINWNTLNRRVFSKMGIRISDSTIQQLIEAKAGAIEQVLWDLRRKIQEAQANTHHTSRSVPNRSKSPTIGTYSTKTYGCGGASNPGNQVPVASRQSVPRDTAESGQHDLSVKSSATTQHSQAPPALSRTGSTVEAHAQPAQIQPAHVPPQPTGYVVPPSVIGKEESGNNNVPFGGPPAQIIYRGHKMIPLGFLEEKDREIKNLESINKSLTVKVHRLETKIDIKDGRIEDLTHQLHALRSVYERVTQQTWQGFTSTA